MSSAYGAVEAVQHVERWRVGAAGADAHQGGNDDARMTALATVRGRISTAQVNNSGDDAGR